MELYYLSDGGLRFFYLFLDKRLMIFAILVDFYRSN